MKMQGNMRRLLSLIMAVVLCMSVVPWSAFAAEGDPAQNGKTEGVQTPDITGMTPEVSGEVAAGSAITFSLKDVSAEILTWQVKIVSADSADEWSAVNNPYTVPAGKEGENVFQVRAVLGEQVSQTAELKYTVKAQEPEAPVVSTIAEARAMASGTEGITVSGTVIFVDGRNVVIQDATGGINLYFSAAPSDIAVGDVIQASGQRGAFNGLEQLSGVAGFIKTGTAELPVKEVTLAEILADQETAALESTRVLIKGAVMGEASGSNIPLTQGDASINLYKAPTLEGIAAGDTVDVYAVIGDFNGYQLRVAAAADVTKVTAEEPKDPWADVDTKYSVYEELASLTNGDVVVVYNPGNAKALSSEAAGYYKAGVDAAVVGEGYIASDSEFIEWTVAIDENGVYTFTQGENKLGIEKSGTYLNLKTNAGEYGFKVEPLAEGSDQSVIYSSSLEGTYGHVYLEWYADKTAFSAYSTGADRVTEKDFGFKFYKLVREGVKVEEPTDPTEPEEPAGQTATLVTDVTALAAGDQIVIVASGSDFALSTTQNGNNRGQAAVTKSADGTTVTFLEDTQVITLEAGTKEGTFAFNVGNGYLYAASASKNYLRTEETLSDNSSWTIEIAEGIATVKAQGENTRNWLRHNASSSLFACYGSGQADISIYKLDKDEPATGVADGKYVIWAPAYNMALSTVYNGFYNTGVAVTEEGGKLSGYTNAEIWTVTNNDDGTITISCEAGSLAMGASFASMPLNEVNSTWTLEPAADGLWYVKNVGRECYIEWYADKNNWSSYKYINEGSEGMFALKFTPAETTEDPEVPSGLADGTYVIWAPGFNKALSSGKTGNYNLGVNVTASGESLSGYEATEIWTVTNQEDGTILISQGGQNLGMDGSNQYLNLGAENAAWTLIPLEGGLYNVQNKARGNMLEWYDKYSNWSTYNSSSAATDPQFQIKFTPVEPKTETDPSVVQGIASWGGMTSSANTDKVYGDKYIVGDEKDTKAVFTAVVSGKAVAPWTKGGNDDAPLYYMGGDGIGSGSDDYMQLAVSSAGWGNMQLSFRLRASNAAAGEFTVQYSTDGVNFTNFTTGSYSYSYTQYGSQGSFPVTGEGTITDGKAKTSLAPGNYVSFAFDVPAGADNAENLYIRLVPGTTKANGEDGAIGATATVRMDTVLLTGSPVISGTVTRHVVVTPNGEEDQAVGTELTMESEEGAKIYYSVNGGEFKLYDAEKKPVLEALPCDIEAYAIAEGKAQSATVLYHYSAGTVESVKVKPNGGSIYIEGESTEVTLSCNTEGAAIYYMTSPDGETWPEEWTEYAEPIVLAKGFGKLYLKAYSAKDGFTDSTPIERIFTERSSAGFGLYFGQLHSHTNYSDGAGTPDEAFEHAANAQQIDFLAVTDHSNSFDNAGNASITDGSMSTEWVEGQRIAEKHTTADFVGIYGYEMTWSNGLGHMNTFNSEGFQSRTQSQFTSYSTALQNYYAALQSQPSSISQFNHPGTTFGDFSDFGHYSEASDGLITLIEVGNGEGAIGSSGYFPSYEYYTRALDKGWHVAPTNNQDNHKGNWGDSNTGRTVVLSDGLTRDGIYDAMRNYRVYATEDNDLNIYYSLVDGENSYLMGSIVDGVESDELVATVRLSDATDAAIGKVEVIVNGGYSAASANVDGSSKTVEITVPADYTYYYIKVTQPDGDIAVTAPVWVGKVEAVGISSLTTDSELTIAGTEQGFTMELFNNENKALEIQSVIYTDQNGKVLYEDKTLTEVGKESTASSSFRYTFATDGMYTITATVKASLNGVEKIYTKDLEVEVMPAAIISNVIIDGTHYNDYVSGYYNGRMNNVTTLAAQQGIDVHVETEQITAQMLENCNLLIVTAPARKAYDNYGVPGAAPFEDDFIALVKQFVENGGSVVVCGLADYQDKSAPAENHTAAQLNKLLAALGSTMTINDDEAYDDENYSNQNYRLYLEEFNMDSKWTKGIVTKEANAENYQTYSQYSGCTVNPGQGTWLVKGFDTTYSIDSDKDGIGGVEKGQAVMLAAEDTGFGGTIFAAGGVFMSDYEVQAELDNIWDLPYANRTIIENIMGLTRAEPEVTPIEDVRASAKNDGLGRIFVIEGYVTSGTANENTTFFDAIYVQDATGGITVFPYSQAGLENGTKVRVTGYTDAYQGDIEIQILTYEILDEEKNVIEPEKVSNKDAMDYDSNGGQLLQVEGEVVEVTLGTDGKVSQFVVKDEKGDLAKVFIDGYILSGTTGENTLDTFVKVGNTVSAVGLLYMHPEGDSTESVAVLRVRDCDEIKLIAEGTGVDKSKLEDAIEAAGKLKEEDYTDKTWKDLEEALKDAEEVLASAVATQAEVDAAAKALEDAMDALKKAEGETTKPTTRPTRPNTGGNAGTGDNSGIQFFVLLFFASGMVLAVLLMKRKKFLKE